MHPRPRMQPQRSLGVAPMSRALLITQCLQTDFVQPIGRYQALPNTLHVGYDEALRLMGPEPRHGPVARWPSFSISCIWLAVASRFRPE